MKSIKTYQKAGLTLVVIAVIIAGAWYVNGKYISKDATTSQANDSASTSDRTATPQTQNTSENLVSATISNGVTEITQTDFSGANKKTLFTDKDEDLKIGLFGGLAYLSKEILVFVGGSPVGKLEVINADGSGKVSIINNSSGKPTSLAISPDGKTVFYVSFSNAEADYGYNIYSINRDGSNRRKIANSQSEVSYLTVNKDGSKIAYIKTDSSGKSEIDTADISSGNTGSIYTSTDKILSLAWNPNDRLTFTDPASKYSAGSVIMINPDGSNSQTLYEAKNSLPVYSAISSDSLNFEVLSAAYGDTFDNSKEGQITVLQYSGENSKNIANANLVLGWLP